MAVHAGQVDLVESYINYEPPFPVAPIVRDLLKCVPHKYLTGLDCIVLTNASGQPRAERRQKTLSRKRRVGLIACEGFYQPAWNGHSPCIELYIDNILREGAVSSGLSQRPGVACLARRIRLGWVLFHELGHHIHYTKKPEHREPENVANGYMYSFLKRMLLNRCYLIPPAIISLAVWPSFWKGLFKVRRGAKASRQTIPAGNAQRKKTGKKRGRAWQPAGPRHRA